MPPLKNIKHEKFCQGVALGDKHQYEVYGEIYTGCSVESSTKLSTNLKRRSDVRARIDELVQQSASDAVLTITQKRLKLRDIVTDNEEHTSNQIKAIEADSKLAGHYRDNNDNEAQALLDAFAGRMAGITPQD